MPEMLRCMSPVMAHPVISRARNNQVAFGEKRTSTGRRSRLVWSRMTLNGHPARAQSRLNRVPDYTFTPAPGHTCRCRIPDHRPTFGCYR
jgi:hypothetical protein